MGQQDEARLSFLHLMYFIATVVLIAAVPLVMYIASIHEAYTSCHVTGPHLFLVIHHVQVSRGK